MGGELPKNEPIWRLEPLADFQAPATPTQETLRKKLALMVKRIRPAKSAAMEQIEHLEKAPSALLDLAAPRPSAEPFFSALDAIVDEWLAHEEPRNRVLVVVLPPCDGVDLLTPWAEKRGAQIVPEPSSESVLAGDLDKLPSFEGDSLLVLPKLEVWFRRHHGGLALVRELIARLSSTKRRCVVGVNSWAWAYLERAADADVELPKPLTLAPFDDQALCAWLSDLAESDQPGRIVFRRDDTGDVVLDPAESCSRSGKAAEENGRSDLLKALAATSRGSSWLAWHLFRRSMRVEGKDGETNAETHPTRQTVWISPKSEVQLPEMSKDARSSALLVLHALLIHGELSLDDLEDVLPPIRTSHLVNKLAAEKLLLERDGKWRVPAEGYPAAREALAHDGFPIDAL